MPSGNELGQLNTGEWDQLQDVANRLEDAWSKGETTELGRFLPPPGNPMRLIILQELVKTDLECRWKRQRAVDLDYYLARYPELAPAITPQLIFEEYRIRQKIGDRPGLDQYKERFPHHFENLKRLADDLSVVTKRDETTVVPAKSQVIPDNVLVEMGGHKLIQRIGQGGFGEVWKAEAPGGFLKAIKVLFRSIDHKEGQRELESLNLIKNTRHHFLLPTQGYWPIKERLYILMDLADGSLRDRLNECLNKKKQGIPLPELMKYMRQTAEALDYLHEKQIEHRDIKPENILLIEGNVRVADFGLARSQHHSMSNTGGVGTPLYMAPEVWDDQVHRNSDQYSLAATYYELRVGKRLFKGQGLKQIMDQHLRNTPELEGLEAEEEKQVLLKSLAKNPNERYASCQEFVQALETALAPQLGSAIPTGSSPALAIPSTITNVDTDMLTLAPGQAPSKRTRPDTERDIVLTPRKWGEPGTGPVKPRSVLLPTLLLSLTVGLAGYLVVRPWLEPGDFSLVPPKAQVVHAGQTITVPIVIERNRFKDQVTITFTQDPDLEISSPTLGPDMIAEEIKVTARDQAQPGTHKITVKATAGELVREDTLELTIKALDTLPAASQAGFFLPAGNSDVYPLPGDKGRKYYRKIECVLPDSTRVPFLLVSWGEPSKAPFYIMEDKVWNGLFARFAAQHSEALAGSRWTLGARLKNSNKSWWAVEDLWMAVNLFPSTPWSGDSLPISPWLGNLDGLLRLDHGEYFPHPDDLGSRDAMLPVLRVDIREAALFAEWLGGKLPLAEQWDTAAGRYEKMGDGPYQGKGEPGEIAVGRKYLGPMPVGTAPKDISFSGCRDMSGNGLEWTRSLLIDSATQEFEGDLAKVPSPSAEKNPRVQIRGQRYDHPRPLRFADIGNLTLDFWQSPLPRPQGIDPQLGFRVVLEMKP